ncbi:MAG: cupin domain-containing protein [Candidatus Binatia bacterium]
MATKQKFDSIGAALVRTKNQPWIDAGDGNQFLVLRISKETGAWSALVKAKAGQVNAPHTHIGPADFYVLSGGFDYRGGSAREGDWVYEPAGAVHEATTHPMDTVYLANVYGPVAFHDAKGGIAGILDWRAVQKMVDAAKKKPAAKAKAKPVKKITAKAA